VSDILETAKRGWGNVGASQGGCGRNRRMKHKPKYVGERKKCSRAGPAEGSDCIPTWDIDKGKGAGCGPKRTQLVRA